MRYKRIIQAIMRKSKEDKIDYRVLLRKWIMLFEETRVTGWDRDKFLDEAGRQMTKRKTLK